MYTVRANSRIASITDLRRSTKALVDSVERGETVVLQRNTEPVGVFLGYREYSELLERVDVLEERELATLVQQRRQDVVSGEEELIPIDDFIDELDTEVADGG